MRVNFNTTVNETQPPNCSSLGNLTAERIGKIFAYCLILIVSLAGNTLIGIIVYKTKSMRKTINYFIVNMAMSDMLVPIFVIPKRIIDLYPQLWSNGHDLFWQVFCKANPLMSYISCFVSTECLILIAVDRFGAVVYPFRRPLINSKLCPYLILATWIFAVVLSFPYVFAFKLVEYEGKWMCMARFSDAYFGEVYLLVLPLLLYVISFASMLGLYSIVVFRLASQKIPGESSSNAEEQRVRRHRNVLQMTVAIVSGFVFCWAPVNTYLFLSYFVWDNTTRLSCGITQFQFFALFLASANSAINPCICFTFSGYYRQGLKSLLRRNSPLTQR
ncbi:RYamide receptor-like [Oculina patagonica]